MGGVVSQTRDHEVPRDILERFAAEEASEEERRQVFRHLLAGCAACQRELRLAHWHTEAREMELAHANVTPLGPRTDIYEEAFAAMHRTAMNAIERLHVEANVLLAELNALSPEEREFRVRNLRRYADGKLAAALVEKSFELRYSDLPSMLHYARLAVAVAEAATPETAGGRSLLADGRARAWAQLGNAQRIHGDLDKAEWCFAAATQHLEAGSGDAQPRAWVARLLASLRIAQRALRDAIELNREAARLYRRLRDRTGEATALLGGAWAQIVDGDPRPAIEPLQRCLEILHPWHPQERKLIQGAATNLVLCYIDVDRPQDAYDTVVLAKPYFEDCADAILRLRWDWQWGKADRDRGHFFSAELLTEAGAGRLRGGRARRGDRRSLPRPRDALCPPGPPGRVLARDRRSDRDLPLHRRPARVPRRDRPAHRTGAARRSRRRRAPPARPRVPRRRAPRRAVALSLPRATSPGSATPPC